MNILPLRKFSPYLCLLLVFMHISDMLGHRSQSLERSKLLVSEHSACKVIFTLYLLFFSQAHSQTLGTSIRSQAPEFPFLQYHLQSGPYIPYQPPQIAQRVSQNANTQQTATTQYPRPDPFQQVNVCGEAKRVMRWYMVYYSINAWLWVH